MIPTGNGQTETGDDPAALARSLEPVIRDSCGGHLSEIEWFKASWQRGGAATGYAVWHPDPSDSLAQDGGDVPVIVKLPVGGTELAWTKRLGNHGLDRDVKNGQTPHPTPRVLESGYELGGHDLGWLVIERLEGKTVARDLTERSLTGLINAAVEFQYRASKSDATIGEAPTTPDWAGALEQSLIWVSDNPVDDARRWRKAITAARKVLDKALSVWESRPINTWCHGDLHPGNAMHMIQEADHPDRCVLIDLALVHPGHWVEDAVYLEHLFWGHEDRLFGIKPVREMRRLRRERGLSVLPGDARLADIKRMLIAASAPSFYSVGGDEKYLSRALELTERIASKLAHE